MKLKKALYFTLGIVCVGMAYVGFILPGIPFSIFLVIAAWAFSKSSRRMHDWLYNHPWFGQFLTNWTQKKVFPTKGKYAMILVMSSSLAILWFTSQNITAVGWSGLFMVLVAGWAWRFPGSVEEHTARQRMNKKIGWIK